MEEEEEGKGGKENDQAEVEIRQTLSVRSRPEVRRLGTRLSRDRA